MFFSSLNQTQTFSNLDKVAVAVDGHVAAVEGEEVEYRGAGRRAMAAERPDALVAGVVVDRVVSEVRRRQQQRRAARRTLHPSAHCNHTHTHIHTYTVVTLTNVRKNIC